MQHLSSAQRWEIACLSRRGFTNTAIAEVFGVHRQTIGRNLRQLDQCALELDATTFTPEEVAEVRELLARFREPQGCRNSGELAARVGDDRRAASEPDELPQW